MNPNHTCVNCTYWDSSAMTDKTKGKCRIRSPRHVNRDSGYLAHGWTFSTDWCGEWKQQT